MKVYHGTTMIVDAPLVSIGRRNRDFVVDQICIIAQQIVDDYLSFVEAIDLRKEAEHG